MKLAFSTSMCPDLDLDTLIEKSSFWGYQGFELVGPHGQPDLGFAALRCEPADANRKLREAGQEIVALHAGALTVSSDAAMSDAVNRVLGIVELAGKLGSPMVLVTGPPLPPAGNKARLLDRCAACLHDLASRSNNCGVTLAVENAGACARSVDLWHIYDAVGLPAVRVCLDPLNAERAGDPPSRAIKRLGGTLAMVRLSHTDAFLNESGERFVELDHSATNPVFLLEQLKGLAYRGWVCLDGPTAPSAAQATAPLEVLERSARFLRTELARPIIELTAYKGDRNAPRFVSQRLAP